MNPLQKMEKKLQVAEKKIRILEDMVENSARELYYFNQELKDKNHEKEILLKEIHHRVKNNLQIITSLLSIQSAFIEDDFLKSIFGNSQRRITSMALVHEMLYQTENLSKINYKNYLGDLSQSIYASFDSPNNIQIETNSEEIYFSVETAVPLGLIINEIITNSLKHGFTDTTKGGFVRVQLSHQDGVYTLLIGDNGVGFKESFRSKSLGLKLIKNLSIQLEASVERISDKPGTTYKIIFEDKE